MGGGDFFFKCFWPLWILLCSQLSFSVDNLRPLGVLLRRAAAAWRDLAHSCPPKKMENYFFKKFIKSPVNFDFGRLTLTGPFLFKKIWRAFSGLKNFWREIWNFCAEVDFIKFLSLSSNFKTLRPTCDFIIFRFEFFFLWFAINLDDLPDFTSWRPSGGPLPPFCAL